MVRVRESEVDEILPSGKISTFPTTMVRPFHAENKEPEVDADQEKDKSTSKPLTHREPYNLLTRTRLGSLSQDAVYVASNAGMFQESRLEELKGLQYAGCFEVVDESASAGHRLYRTVFVDKVKNDGEKKSRM